LSAFYTTQPFRAFGKTAAVSSPNITETGYALILPTNGPTLCAMRQKVRDDKLKISLCVLWAIWVE